MSLPASTPSRRGGGFYVTGGTLKPGAPSYIERPADRELYESCLAGELCWVLTTRQMGKSSLMARTAQRLQADGVRTAIVDLSLKSKKEGAVSAGQWFYGIAHTILRELGISVGLGEWWKERANLPAVQRFLELFEDVILPNVDGRLVVFFDEIDSTLDLPFSDDFFAAIRGCFNARATNEAFERLTFVLLGTATPAQLVSDPARTPFNVGRGIELNDFTLEEARPLAKGLHADAETSELLLQRVLHWTGGHPYLTQTLCRSVAEQTQEAVGSDPKASVDSLVQETFLGDTAARKEVNLSFVAKRLTAEGPSKRRTLQTYRQIRRGKSVEEEPRSSVHAALKLSGVVKRDRSGRLRVRNRIYKNVFTPSWARRELPTDRRLVLAAAVLLLSVSGFFYWYFFVLPQSFIQTLQTASQDVEVAYQSYDRLRALPFFRARADELLAQFWERRGDRDRALITRIQALTQRDSEQVRRRIGGLMGEDYESLENVCRYGGSVRLVSLSPRYDAALIGGEEGVAQVWSISSCQPLTPPLHHDAAVLAVAFSPRGDFIATGSADNTARVWSTTTGEPLTSPLLHRDQVSVVAVNPELDSLVTGSDDGTARVWSVLTGEPLTPSLQHDGPVFSVAFSPLGDVVATGSQDNTARVWSSATGEPLTPPLLHGQAVLAVAFSPKGNAVVTGSEDGTVRVWRSTDGKALIPPLKHDASVLAVAFSPKGDVIATGGLDSTVRLWSASTGKPLWSPLLLGGPVAALAFSPRGDAIVAGGLNNTVRAWSVSTGKALSSLLLHGGPISAVAFGLKGESIVSGGLDNTVRVWSLSNSGDALLSMPHPREGMWTVAIASQDDAVVLGNSEGTVRVLSTATGEPLGPALKHDDVVEAIHSHGDVVVTGSHDGTAHLWSEATGAPLTLPLRHRASVVSVALSPRSDIVATGSRDGTARVWSVKSGEPLTPLLQHKGAVYGLAFSPLGDLIATGSVDRTARLWNTATGKPLTLPLQHGAGVFSVALSPRRDVVVTGTSLGTIHLWSTKTGEELSPPVQLATHSHVTVNSRMSVGFFGTVTSLGFLAKDYSFFVKSGSWVYRYSIVGKETLVHTGSDFIPDSLWRHSIRVYEGCASCLEVFRLDIGRSVIVDFEDPRADPVEGDPEDLLRDWQQRLALKIENGRISPMWPTSSGAGESDDSRGRQDAEEGLFENTRGNQ